MKASSVALGPAGPDVLCSDCVPEVDRPCVPDAQERLGYSLDVRASLIGHQGAGDGLWLQGHAPVGALVALYPGIVYTPLHYR